MVFRITPASFAVLAGFIASSHAAPPDTWAQHLNLRTPAPVQPCSARPLAPSASHGRQAVLTHTQTPRLTPSRAPPPQLSPPSAPTISLP